MGNHRLYKIQCLQTLGRTESKRLKVTALNLFHPTVSPPFQKVDLFYIATQSLGGEGEGGEHERLASMRKIFLWNVCVFILFHLVFHPVVFCATGQEVLNEIQNRYEKTNDFEASFIQEYIGKGIGQSNRGEGKVYFKKRGMMRWDYAVPNQKFVSDGHTLWYYQPEEKQVLVSNVSSVLKEKTPLAFLAGEGNLSRDFNFLSLNESASEKEDSYAIELAPKEPMGTLLKLALTVDKKTYTILQADVFDEFGNLTRTRFINIKTNVGVSSSFFQLTIPPGTEVIKMQGPSASSSGGKGLNKK